MRVHYLTTQLFFLSLYASVSFCKATADDVRTPFQVVGSAVCADCKKNNFKTSQAFAGLSVTIDCKLKNGDMKRVAITQLNELGRFKVSLPEDIVHENGQNLKEQCYAKLHNAAAMPCPAPTTKIVHKSPHTFAPSKTLQFSATLCTSKFFWPYFNHPWFKHPWFNTPTPVYTPPVVTPPVYTPPVVMPQPPETGPLPPPEVPISTPPPMEEPLPPPPVELPPPVNNPPKQPCPPTEPVTPPVNEPLAPPPMELPPELPPPVNCPPKHPCPTGPVTPPANEPPMEPLPPPPMELPPPIQPLPPPVPNYVPHPFFKHPKYPWPPIPGHQ